MFLKVGHLTMDNTSNNGTMMNKLEKLLSACELPFNFDAVNQRIMCYAHVVDLSCRHIVFKLSKKLHAEDWDEPSSLNKPTYMDVVGQDMISHAHTVVQVI